MCPKEELINIQNPKNFVNEHGARELGSLYINRNWLFAFLKEQKKKKANKKKNNINQKQKYEITNKIIY